MYVGRKRVQSSLLVLSPPRNTANTLNTGLAAATQDSSFLDDMLTRYQGTGGVGGGAAVASRRGGVASAGTATTKGGRSKPVRAWPEMGSLEWLVVKQVLRNQRDDHIREINVVFTFFPTQNPEGPCPDSSFVAMAAMHSEILLVSSESRQLYSWPCSADALSPKPHPLSEELGLEGERIALLEASDIRATLVTESGKVASFYDGLLRCESLKGLE